MKEFYQFMIMIDVHCLDILIVEGMFIIMCFSQYQPGAHSAFGYSFKWYNIDINVFNIIAHPPNNAFQCRLRFHPHLHDPE